VTGFGWFVTTIILATLAFQVRNPDAGVAGACGCLGFVGFVIFAIIVLNIALLVWVARDAKARGMDSAILWMILVMFTGVIGLVIYLFSRPQGNTISCAHCGNRRLQVSAKCPHCGNT
jgi:phospholipase D-like protein